MFFVGKNCMYFEDVFFCFLVRELEFLLENWKILVFFLLKFFDGGLILDFVLFLYLYIGLIAVWYIEEWVNVLDKFGIFFLFWLLYFGFLV